MMSEVVIKDFSHSLEPKKFRINDDVFEASPEMPLGMIQDLAKFMVSRDELSGKGLEVLLELFDALLFDASAAKFRERTKDKEKPIGVSHAIEIVPWLLEQYGLRPTQPSSPSSNGSDDGITGTNLTDGRSLAELMQLSSQLTEPSTSSTSS
jgi:hypothetical protein